MTLRRLIAPVALLAALAAPSAAVAAGSPEIVSTSVEGVSASGAVLRAEIRPNGLTTTYRFEYLTEAAYEANLNAAPPRDPFQGAALAPVSGARGVGGGGGVVTDSQHLIGLTPETAYRYRAVASNSAGTATGADHPFATQPPTNAFELLDNRGWELVSPIEKNGGSISFPETIAGGGVFQAAAGGGAITYSSADSFGGGAGAPAGSQYLAARGEAGWSNANITTPLLSGSYGSEPNGVPYQLFSSDLSRGLLSNGERCRGIAGGECPVLNPPLPGTGAPSGYRNYYLRSGSGSFQSILTSSDLLNTPLTSAQLELRFAGGSPDLSHIVLASCAALSPDATETATPGTCETADQNLYEWSGGSLVALNLLPAASTTTPGAAIAAPAGAVSSDGSRVYWTAGGNLYLREGSQTKQVDAAIGGGGEFQTASSDGATAYVTKGGNLYRYAASTGSLTPLAGGGDVEGVLGASTTGGAVVYYLTSAGLFVSSGATTSEVAPTADATDFPPATGTARVSADGRFLVFTSTAPLTGYPSEGETEVFRYGPLPGASTPALLCVSCNPTGEAPAGGASIPGALKNGSREGAVDAYKPRVLSADGNRIFFDSADPLVAQDTNKSVDVYEWEAAGAGTCTRAGGCIQLISSGRDPFPSTFLDASSDGSDAYFLTAASLYPLDPGSYDVYDARVDGGFSAPEAPIACDGDACQVLPEAPEDPTPGTLVPNSGNPPLRITGTKPKPKHKKRHRRHKKPKHKAKGGGKGQTR